MRKTSIGLLGAGLFLSLSGCSGNGKILNPAHIDANFGSRGGGAAPENVNLYAGPLDLSTREAIQAGAFFPAWKAAVEQRMTAESAVSARTMLLRGIALSDRNCAAWFQNLAETQANIAFNRDVLSSTGALTAAIMGLTRASSPAVAGVAAATGFGERLIDSASANFIVAPDLGLVQDLVTRLRADQVSLISSQANLDYDNVLILLIAYDNTCSHTKVKQLVNQSVANATKAVTDSTSNSEQSIIGQINPYFMVGSTLGPDQVVALYALLVAATDPASGLTEANKAYFIKVLVDSKVAAAGATFTNPMLNLAPAYAGTQNRASATETVRSLLKALLPKTAYDAVITKQASKGTSASPKTLEAVTVVGKVLRQQTLALPSIQR